MSKKGFVRAIMSPEKKKDPPRPPGESAGGLGKKKNLKQKKKSETMPCRQLNLVTAGKHV